MIKFLTVVSIFCFLAPAFGSSGILDGKKYCRPVISDGLFGQPKGTHEACLSFSNGIVIDSNDTIGGNPPLTYPYQTEANTVKFGDSEYTLSMDRSALMTITGPTHAGVIYVLKVTNINDLHVPQSWIFGKVNPKSLASQDQLKILQKVILIEIASKRTDEDSRVIINANLQSLALPEIEFNPEVEIIGNSGGVVGSIQGATLKDSKHLYCLPCLITPSHG